MNAAFCFAAALLGLTVSGFAQPVFVYSEFAQVGADGEVKSPPRPREILSPALARNAFASFQVVVQVEAGKSWWLHVGQNPENAVDVTMYRESGDRLEKVEVPVKGEGTQVFWMDLWTARSAPVGRIKVEPQLNIDDDWVIYPMEARVSDPVAPAIEWKPGGPSPSARDVMRAFLCGGGVAGAGPSSAGALTPAQLRYRNALQDRALADQVPKADLQKLFGACEAPAPANPESYYPIRDLLFKHTLH